MLFNPGCRRGQCCYYTVLGQSKSVIWLELCVCIVSAVQVIYAVVSGYTIRVVADEEMAETLSMCRWTEGAYSFKTS